MTTTGKRRRRGGPPSLWAMLDRVDDENAGLDQEETDEFFERVAEEVKMKLSSSPQAPMVPGSVVEATGELQTSAVPTFVATSAVGSPSPSVPAPSVETPVPRPKLRAPRPSALSRVIALDSPMSIPTPQATTSVATPGSVGRAKRDAPDSPVVISRSKDAGPWKKLSAHFVTMDKALARQGKARYPGYQLGGSIFKGLRFLMPVSAATPFNQIKQRSEIVVLEADTAITHVIRDSGSASALAADINIDSLSDLPEGTMIVKFEWVSRCKMAVLETSPFLTFPPTKLNPAPSAGAATRLLASASTSAHNSLAIRRQREHTASDSETESSEPPNKNPRLTNAQMVQQRFIYQGEPRPSRWPSAIGRTAPPSSPQASRAQVASSSSEVHDVATRHTPAPRPGWVEPGAGDQDGLDVMIMGVKNGSVPSDEVDSEAADDSEPEPGNPSPLADKFKCGQKHDGLSAKGPNEWLAVEFDKLHDLYQGMQGKNEFAVRGYQRTAGILRRTAHAIKSGKQARQIKGIGGNMADRIDEFLTGAQGRAFYEDTDRARALATFKDVYGVGKSFAHTLYERGARTIDDLRTKDFDLTTGQKIGVELYDDLKARIPRDECRQLFEAIRAAALAIDKDVWIEIMGSYRRGSESSGDVDILITRDTADGKTHAGVLRKLHAALLAQGIITHDLSVPGHWDGLEAKWMGVGRVSPAHKHRRIDILCIPLQYWGAALIYFTGNDVFNRSLRLFARKKGYSLNQRGLSEGVIRDRKGNKMTEGKMIASKSEEEIFEVLGIRWRPPHQRRP